MEKVGRAMTLTEAVSAIELKEKMEDSSDSTSCCDDTSHPTASSDITLRIFGQPQDIAKIASGLAQFGVSPLKIDTLYTDADTTLCYAPKPMRYPHAAVVLPPSIEAPHCALITDPPRLSLLAPLNDLLREAPQLDQGKNSLSVDGPSTVSSWSTLLIRHARRSSRFDSTQGTEKLQPRKDLSPKRPECRDDHD
ncbi:unnamed protein product [Heligmosomoides polygyrus]|uniref:PRE_C2HC domain-containing protein n=1 Tax=Heligmosomoides polygyrus TaxID=6339 RepID=A0A183GFI6_HELPZ|nr:unnamed protein product [Heligmosomoides polygyrus]